MNFIFKSEGKKIKKKAYEFKFRDILLANLIEILVVILICLINYYAILV